MKRLFFILWTCGFATVVGFTQGQVHFINNVLGDPRFVFYPDCATKVAGDTFRAQLYAAPAGSSEAALVPVPPAVVFLPESIAAGLWNAAIVTIPFLPPGQRALVQGRVWQAPAETFEAAVASGFLYGTSKSFELTLGSSDIGLPATMLGLESFCLIPEPSPWALAVVGSALLFGLGRFRGLPRSA
jgi:hypothetical protein